MNSRFWILLLAIVCLWSASCVMVPVPTGEDKVLAGKPVREEHLAFLLRGVTTRQEVLEHLGKPAVIWENARLFVYHWQMRQGILFWAVGGASQGGMSGGAGMTDIPRHYLLPIKFDEQGRVQRFERVVCPMHKTYSECLKAWERGPDDASPRNQPAQRGQP